MSERLENGGTSRQHSWQTADGSSVQAAHRALASGYLSASDTGHQRPHACLPHIRQLQLAPAHRLPSPAPPAPSCSHMPLMPLMPLLPPITGGGVAPRCCPRGPPSHPAAQRHPAPAPPARAALPQRPCSLCAAPALEVGGHALPPPPPMLASSVLHPVGASSASAADAPVAAVAAPASPDMLVT